MDEDVRWKHSPGSLLYNFSNVPLFKERNTTIQPLKGEEKGEAIVGKQQESKELISPFH